jgi:hypothetical protein
MIIPLASFSKLLRGSMISYAVESDGGSNGNGGQASKEGSFPATKVPDSLRRNKILLNARAAIEKGNGNGGKGPSLQEIMTMDDLQLLLNGSLSVAAMASTAGGTWQIVSTSSAAQSSPENGHESAFRRSFSLSSTGQGSETAKSLALSLKPSAGTGFNCPSQTVPFSRTFSPCQKITLCPCKATAILILLYNVQKYDKHRSHLLHPLVPSLPNLQTAQMI